MKDLNVLVDKLCEDLTNTLCGEYKHCMDNGAHYAPKVGKKYIKIVSYDNAHKGGGSVWGFINIAEFKKGLCGITFKEGDVLKASGWRAPAQTDQEEISSMVSLLPEEPCTVLVTFQDIQQVEKEMGGSCNGTNNTIYTLH